MSKQFAINLQAKNIVTFEQEDELIAGEAIKVKKNSIFSLFLLNFPIISMNFYEFQWISNDFPWK